MPAASPGSVSPSNRADKPQHRRRRRRKSPYRRPMRSREPRQGHRLRNLRISAASRDSVPPSNRADQLQHRRRQRRKQRYRRPMRSREPRRPGHRLRNLRINAASPDSVSPSNRADKPQHHRRRRGERPRRGPCRRKLRHPRNLRDPLRNDPTSPVRQLPRHGPLPLLRQQGNRSKGPGPSLLRPQNRSSLVRPLRNRVRASLRPSR